MDDAAQLLAMLSHAYGAQSVSVNIPSPVAKNVTLARVSTAHRSTFEHLLTATRNVGHELVSVLASKVALERVLDQLPFGLLLITTDLKVLSANRFARGLLEVACGLTVVKRRLACMDGRSHQKLEHGIQRLLNKSPGVARTTAIRVARGNDQPDLQLSIANCGTLHPVPAAPDIPAFCIWVFDPGAHRALDGEMLRELHGLTVSEAAVTAALFRGLSIDEVATELGVTANTVKTHLKHIFQKCEVRSQAELLQMLALGPR
jgi:DNA-binding CsgD family transcriptional regulator